MNDAGPQTATSDPAVAVPGRRATIRDVAALAGVSKSLVSRVVRGEPNVSPDSRAKVLDAMDRLSYRPNTIARGLSESRSGTVGVVINDLRNPWFVNLVEGLATTLDAVGIAPLIVDSHLDHRVGRDTVDTLLSRQVDGLVIVGTTEARIDVERAAAFIPVVLAGTLDPDLPSVDVAVDDDVIGARLATEHLLDLGHRRIAHLAGPGIVGTLRRRGFADAMTAAGADASLVEHAGMNEDGGYGAAGRLLDLDDPPTALVAFNDMTALGALSAADDRRLAVPHDLSVVGYDDTYLARIRRISLTSVDNGNFAVGTQAAKFLLQRLDNPELPRRVHRHRPALTVRGSTAARR